MPHFAMTMPLLPFLLVGGAIMFAVTRKQETAPASDPPEPDPVPDLDEYARLKRQNDRLKRRLARSASPAPKPAEAPPTPDPEPET